MPPTTCSWCRATNDPAATACEVCGHRPDLPRLDCDCVKCLTLRRPVSAAEVGAIDDGEMEEV